MGKIILCAILETLTVVIAGAKSFCNMPEVEVLSKEDISRQTLTVKDEVTLFCVEIPQTERESALWTLQSDTSDIVMTTHRMAATDAGRYINFMEEAVAQPIIVTYQNRLGNTSTLRAGIASKKGLPIEDNARQGMQEMILSHRTLSYYDRKRIETYLALKYDISLSQIYPTSYLSSHGEVIWDAEKLSEYSHNIAGIGRDDASALDKKTACSISAPNLFRVECHDTLSDQQFLLLGDNLGHLEFKQKRGETKTLGRKWNVSLKGDFSNKRLRIIFDESQIKAMYPLSEGEHYWLAIDTPAETLYHKADRSAVFENIFIPKDVENATMRLLAAPDFFVEVQTKASSCVMATGEVAVNVVGGSAPFVASLSGASQTTVDRRIVFSGLPQNTYSLLVTDAGGRSYSLEFLLSNIEMADIPYFEPIQIKEGEQTEIDASVQRPSYSYSWQLPDGAVSYGSEIVPQSAGVYILTACTDDGCSTQRELEVSQLPSSVFLFDKVFPNPTKDGMVYFKVQLTDVGILNVGIHDMNGHLLEERTKAGDSYYTFACYLPATGVYIVTLESGNERKTYKIVRE